ncbi:hypothetical protein KEM48_002838 [Puccinia striiformis f. sp. tritici PST-130]|nr:hypothetical protein KEM48_002838 [Puccinia striiformis f. sp. tritici PST-130]
MSVAMYLIVLLLIGIGLTIKGLAKWGIANQEWEKHSLRSLISSEKPRPEMSHFKNQKGEEIVWSLAVIGFTHLVGAIVYTGLIRFIDPNQAKNSFQLYLSLLILTSLPLLILKFNPPRKEKTGMIFEPIQLMLSGCFISVISVLNFPLGVRIGFLLSIHPFTVIAWVATTLAFFSPNFDLSLILSNHSVLDAWFLPVLLSLSALYSFIPLSLDFSELCIDPYYYPTSSSSSGDYL